ncbi:hypothetical protein [Dyella caseinilytica]|uniref:Peptidase C39-like domain-containing protein n=1 Tax=Dyella caseinilytica TaxID=1849581 RepID=A0ABX7GVL8_9GAMM|nr:hypothetical protein [Dyella caseinilytica]QRN54345.1 hypothetical protein ISN74_02870 [Dyella caseinilytica]GFZ93449.1 hypothetical protein GCM10011408_11510 [Dyella caseinilytica]
MPKTVTNPPALIAQETPAWCFAAAELMARNYYGLGAPSQYAIARASLMQLVAAQAPPTFAQWNDAVFDDLLSGEQENGGANLNSEQVQLIRNSYGAVNHAAINGRLQNNYTPGNFRADIDSGNIVIIGSAIHYYVVYGYDDTNNFTLLVRDPWPAGVGGQRQRVAYDDFVNWAGRTAISFR